MKMKSLSVEGQHVFFHSSTSMSELKSESVDLVVTSPPYWNLKAYGRKQGQIGDSPYEDYLEDLNRVWDEAYRVAKPGGIFVLNVNSRRNKGRFYPIAFDIAHRIRGWSLWDVLIWYIPNALPQPNHYMERLFDNKFEYLLVFMKGTASQYKFHKPRVPQKYVTADPRAHKKNSRGRCLGNIIRIPAYRPPNIRKQGYHEAAYPEELAALMLETFSDPGDTILDPFLGSGTTLKVSRVMNRKGVGYDVNFDYAPLIEKRICEPWAIPDWKKLDIFHSTTMETGMRAPRKAHFAKLLGDRTLSLL
jgi:modification methylase